MHCQPASRVSCADTPAGSTAQPAPSRQSIQAWCKLLGMWLHEAAAAAPKQQGGGGGTHLTRNCAKGCRLTGREMKDDTKVTGRLTHPPDKELCEGVQVDRQVYVGDGSVLQVNGGGWRRSANKSLILCLLSCAAIDAGVA